MEHNEECSEILDDSDSDQIHEEGGSEDDNDASGEDISDGVAGQGMVGLNHFFQNFQGGHPGQQMVMFMNMMSSLSNPGGELHQSRDGPITEDQLALLSTANQHGHLQQAVAARCAEVASMLRHLPCTLPPEIALAIAERSCDLAGLASAWLCNCLRGGSSPHADAATAWSADALTPSCLAVCSRCGKASVISCTPRVQPQPGGEWHRLRTAHVATGQVCFERTRHFMFEPPTALCHAVRHRMSGYHSFRSVVAAEWVLHGSVAYEIQIDSLCSLDKPAALAVGCVSPGCDVNSHIGWAPGLQPGSWGFVIEQLRASAYEDGEDDESDDEHRALPADPVHTSGMPSPALTNNDRERLGVASGGDFVLPSGEATAGHVVTWPLSSENGLGTTELSVMQGDHLIATIDGTARTFHLKVLREGSGCVFARTLGDIRGDVRRTRMADTISGRVERGLALCVALKYAHDAVTLKRCQ